MKKRDLFSELMQGVEEMGRHRKGEIALSQYKMEGAASIHQADQGQPELSKELGAVKAKRPDGNTD